MYISVEFKYNALEVEDGELPSVLVDKNYMGKNNLSIGDVVEVVIEAGKKNYTMDYEIMGYMTSSMSTMEPSYNKY